MDIVSLSSFISLKLKSSDCRISFLESLLVTLISSSCSWIFSKPAVKDVSKFELPSLPCLESEALAVAKDAAAMFWFVEGPAEIDIGLLRAARLVFISGFSDIMK